MTEDNDPTMRSITRAGLIVGLALVVVMLVKAVQAPTFSQNQDACAYGMCKVGEP